MKSIEYIGLWWLANETPDTAIAGILTFNNKIGLELDLIGAFPDELSHSETKKSYLTSDDFIKDYDIILGVTRDSKRITLNGCHSKGTHFGFPGFKSQRLSVKFALIGVHFSHVEELNFYKTSINYSYLFDWSGVSGFTTQIAYKNKKELERYSVTYSFPNVFSVLTDETRISLESRFHSISSFKKRYELIEATHFSLESEIVFSLEKWIQEYVHPFQNFLTFATMRPNSLIEMIVYSKEHFLELTDKSRQEIPINVLFRTNFYEEEPYKDLIQSDMLFTLKDSSDDLSILAKWLSLTKHLKGVLDIFFSVQYSSEMYIQDQFLNVVQAIEGYHRGARNDIGESKFCNEAIPQKEYDGVKKLVIQHVPKKYKKLFSSKFQFNEPSLRKRVEDLTNFHYDFKNLLISDVDKFSKKVAVTRNYLMHLNPSRRSKIPTGPELYWITQALTLLLQTHFLVDLGFSQERCMELVTRNQRLSFQIREMKKYL